MDDIFVKDFIQAVRSLAFARPTGSMLDQANDRLNNIARTRTQTLSGGLCPQDQDAGLSSIGDLRRPANEVLKRLTNFPT